ncbi:hypothetical protein [Blastococcus sp. PRF04-17]|uniref:hypothetical protein n=1 Tax=Blastococcus sp. PRF04-17 TaxID=2933797 RepID=UPI001FF16B30|nr:hypothetical protein [Blastococcus sp. PRF04-17]UOY01737.1 hypothetical protein MVA48_22925 [Blastococcus sp. PRF04-17]
MASKSVPEAIRATVGALPSSKKQLKKLGQRLVDGTATAEDQESYNQTIAFYDDLQAATVNALVHIPWEKVAKAPGEVIVAGRAKTLDTLLQKLERTPEIGFANVRDVAGVRVVGDFTLAEQDVVVGVIKRVFQCPDAQIIDRRAQPEAGYRAVHVVLPLCGVHVEVQVRTRLQHHWAELFERLADQWGRQIRYGGAPDPGDSSELAETRKEFVHDLQQASVEVIAPMEETRSSIDLLRRAVTGDVQSDDPMLERIARTAPDMTITSEELPDLPPELAHTGNLTAVLDWEMAKAQSLANQLGESLLQFSALLAEDEETQGPQAYDEGVTQP